MLANNPTSLSVAPTAVAPNMECRMYLQLKTTNNEPCPKQQYNSKGVLVIVHDAEAESL